MTRTIPGSGAVIEPIFNKDFGVDAVVVKEGGSDYVATDPPKYFIHPSEYHFGGSLFFQVANLCFFII